MVDAPVNVMWEKQFTRLEFSKLVTIDLAAKYVRRKNNEMLSKMYLEQKIARKVLGYYYDDSTVKWVLKKLPIYAKTR